MRTFIFSSFLCIFCCILYGRIIAQPKIAVLQETNRGVAIAADLPPFKGFLPVKELYYTSSFGFRYHPVMAKRVMHNGVDLRADFMPVHAFSSGIVKKVAYDKRSGIYIVIAHTDKLESIYCHLSHVQVFPGEVVKGNMIIAISGATGMVTGPHLHFAIKLDGHYINPKPILGLIANLKEYLNPIPN